MLIKAHLKNYKTLVENRKSSGRCSLRSMENDDQAKKKQILSHLERKLAAIINIIKTTKKVFINST